MSNPAPVVSKRAARTRKSQLPNELKAVCKEAIQNIVWSKSPILYSDKDRHRFAQVVAIATDLPPYHFNALNVQQNLDEFVEEYAQGVTSLLNDKRAGVIGNIKKRILDDLTSDHQNIIPPLEDLEKVVLRDPASDLDTFVWWWDVILPAVVGKETHWNNTVRYYTTIGEHLFEFQGKNNHT